MAQRGHTLPLETVRLLDETDEIDIEPGGPHAHLGPRTIWVVAVDDDVYLRSRRAAAGTWYLRALADRRATLIVEGRRLPVALAPVADRELQARVSEAYRRKYLARWREDTEALLARDAEAATLRVLAT